MSEADPEPRVRRKRRQPTEIMERLLAAAEEEFKASGYVGGTTAAIARRAEITEAQLFRYFPSKAELFRRTMVQPLDNHLQNFLIRQDGNDNDATQFSEGARAYISELQDFITEHERMFLSLVAADAYAHHNIEGVSNVDSLREYFEHGAKNLAARTREHVHADPKLMVRVSFAAVLACVIFRDWLFPHDVADEPAIREAVVHFVLYGINGEPPSAPSSGRKAGPEAPGKKRRGAKS